MTNLQLFLYIRNSVLWECSREEVIEYASNFQKSLDFFLNNIHSISDTKELVLASADIGFPGERREFFRCLNLIMTHNEDAPLMSQFIDIMGRDWVDSRIRSTEILDRNILE